MYEDLFKAGHTVCSNCRSLFPHSWVKTKDAVQEGSHFFCSDKCRKVFHCNQETQRDQKEIRVTSQLAETFHNLTKAELIQGEFKPFITE